MTRHISAAIASLALIVSAGAGTAGAQARTPFAAESRLWFDGTSTVRSFSCKAGALEGYATAAAAGDLMAAAATPLAEGAVEIPVEALDCGNGKMNDHMRKALKAGEHPVIRFRYTTHETAPAEGGALAVTITGQLELAGTEKTVTLTGQAVSGEAGALRVTGQTEINMKEYGIKPPSLMLGTMKVRERVTVHFDVILPATAMVGEAR